MCPTQSWEEVGLRDSETLGFLTTNLDLYSHFLTHLLVYLPLFHFSDTTLPKSFEKRRGSNRYLAKKRHARLKSSLERRPVKLYLSIERRGVFFNFYFPVSVYLLCEKVYIKCLLYGVLVTPWHLSHPARHFSEKFLSLRPKTESIRYSLTAPTPLIVLFHLDVRIVRKNL